VKTITSVKLMVANPSNEILVVRRADNDEFRRRQRELPGGEITITQYASREELNRQVISGGARELWEETGLQLDDLDIVAVKGPITRTSKYGHINKRHLIVARTAILAPAIRYDSVPGGPIEHFEHGWMTPGSAYEAVSHPVQRELIAAGAIMLARTGELELVG
jgi:8-oxo-dGTP pyrophosphatase MutT (NUDIX family)